MVSLTLITTLFVGVLLSFQSAPVNGQDWQVDWNAARPAPQPRCRFNLFDGIGEGIAAIGKGAGDLVQGIGLGVGGLAQGVGRGVGNLAQGVGRGVGELAVGVGRGVGDAALGIGLGVGDAALGIGQGVGDAAVGIGQGVGDAVVGVGQGVGHILGGVGTGVGAIAAGLGTCLMDVGLGIGMGLHNLFHGCHWHIGGSNHGAISIGLPGQAHLANNIQNGPHVTYTSSFANGKGLITFYFTLVKDGKTIAKFSKGYPMKYGSGSEVRSLLKTFVSYCKQKNHHYHAEAPPVSGNIVWSTKSVDGHVIITLTYKQYSGQKVSLSKSKSYVLDSGSQEEVKDAIAKFKDDLQSGEI